MLDVSPAVLGFGDWRGVASGFVRVCFFSLMSCRRRSDMVFSPAARVRPYICNPAETLSPTREDDGRLRRHGNGSPASASLNSSSLAQQRIG